MSQNKIKVLLADDNKDFCDVVAGHLNQQEDMSVISVAVDGIDAMNKIRDTRPDVAIIDGIMPRLDGLGVLERLQKNDEEYRPITIILSALSQDKVVQKALDLGASYYMVKPFDMDAHHAMAQKAAGESIVRNILTGRRFFSHRNIPIEHSFLYTAQNPTMARAREISALLLDRYDHGELQKIFLVYTDMENAASFQARSTRLLPFHRTHFSVEAEEPITESFEFLPDPRAVLDSMMPSYVSGFIYSALIDSFCCEQNARMTAMDNADRNAEKLLGELSLQYNRVRQAAITQEITEISAGARAQRQKKGR